MKKSIFTFLMLLSMVCLQAQTLPNNGFENWSNNQPVSWTTSLNGNILTELVPGLEIPIPVSVSFGASTTDSHGGSYALQLHPATFGVPGTEYSYLLPGIAQLGTSTGFNIPLSLILDIAQGNFSDIDFSDVSTLSSLAGMVAPGDACTSTPYGVKMWVKFMPEDGDTLIVTAFTKSNGVPVSYAYFTTGVTMNEYTQIEAQFDNPLSACDSLCIIIVAGGLQTHENTTLIVDDVTLNYSNVAVEDHQKKSFAIFPNPAIDQLTIQSPEGRFNYQLHDLTGRLLLSGNGEGQEMISVSALPAGAYMLRLQSDSQIITKKVIIR
ncbi:MAG: T9SS type A sorting domain-containing protein [Bacteroidales bacterium]|nr:T9SS type A sorting domain-containing protein [Bacteroidales bacterium]